MGRWPIGVEKRNTYLAVIIFFSASLTLGDSGIRVYVYVLGVSAPHQIVAAVTEPITTKLVPAIVIVYLHERDDFNLQRWYIRKYPYWFGLIGGLSLGVLERILYVSVKGASISAPFLIAPWMHALNAILIAGFVFRTEERQGSRYVAILSAIIALAMAIHLFWNTQGVLIAHRYFSSI